MTTGLQSAPDIGALLEALRADVRARRLAQGHAEPTSRERDLHRALDEIELYRVVSAHWPLTSTTLPQRAINFVNKIVRRGLRWYINPIVEQQNAYNDAVARVLRLLAEAYADLEEPGQGSGVRGQGSDHTETSSHEPEVSSDPVSRVPHPASTQALQSYIVQQAANEPPARFPELALAGAARQLALHQTVSAHWALGGATPMQRLAALAQKGVRRGLRWLINPVVEQQNAANAAFTVALLALIRVDEERRASIAQHRSQESGVRSQRGLTPDS